MPLTEIRRRHINDLVHRLAAEGKARNSIRNLALAPLRRMLNDAVDDELLLANPAVRIDVPDQAPTRQAVIPEPAELAKIVAQARPDAADVITVAASLGPRRGEAFALRWADVDLAERVVRVRATNHRAVVAERTKTKAGRRLPLFESARKVLAARKLRLAPELTQPDSFVFANAFGGEIDPGNWYRREWLPALEAAGMAKRFHFHELRHFAATRLDEHGMGGKLRTEIIGHADEEITNSVYTHVGRERVAAAAREYDPLAPRTETAMAENDTLDRINTLDDVGEFINYAYASLTPSRFGHPDIRERREAKFGYIEIGRLPLAVAEPGPLMERAVDLAGADGLTLQQLRGIIDLGQERFERGLSFMRGAGRVVESRERRPNRAGRLQEQVVFRATGRQVVDGG